MKPSPKLQAFIQHLATKHGLDLSHPHATLRLTMPGRDDWLVIDTGDSRHVSVSRCCADVGSVEADPSLLLLTDYPTGWLPLDLLYSPREWEAFVEMHSPVDDPEAVDLVTLTEYWATLFAAQGWLERGVKDEPETLQLVCDCPESGDACGTWLELTSDGFLVLEDKDGLCVSLMLPEWLEEAMRTAMLTHAAADEGCATTTEGGASQTSATNTHHGSYS